MRALFICSRNRWRSPTAEAVFANWPGIETDSAGLASDAATIVSTDHIAWAEIIFVMERAHKASLSRKFGSSLNGKQVVCLDIPDKFTFMQQALIDVLVRKAGRFLRRS
jgi:predicted protein tyrosine phosphatase